MEKFPRSVSVRQRMPPNHGDNNFGSEEDNGKHLAADVAGIEERVNTFGV